MEEKQKYEKTTLLGNAVKRSLKLPYPACQEKKRKEKKRKEKKRKEKKRKEKKRKEKTRQDKTRQDKTRKEGGGQNASRHLKKSLRVRYVGLPCGVLLISSFAATSLYRWSSASPYSPGKNEYNT